jgi:hypothetical protein
MHSDGMTDQPVTMQWDGEAFKPVNDFWAKRCDKLFVIGERYAIVEHHERSMASHKHYFSLIAEAWLNLPEKLAGEFPNPESLRKYALITAGYCTGNKIVCRDEDEARAMILLVASMDEYAVCDSKGPVVTIWRAKSQSLKAMGKKDFQISKDKVLNVISQLIGADITERSQVAA